MDGYPLFHSGKQPTSQGRLNKVKTKSTRRRRQNYRYVEILCICVAVIATTCRIKCRQYDSNIHYNRKQVNATRIMRATASKGN